MHICPACNATYDDDTKFCPKDGTPLEAVSGGSPNRVGQIIADRYRLTKRLGEGGMGEVYLAEHVYISKQVALKLLRPEIANNAEAVERFHREARATSSIGHENIITIDDFGRLPDGSVFFTMEFLEGEPLSDLMLKGPMDSARALNIIIQVCRGLAAAHDKEIVHRDMKPDNVFVTKDGRGNDLVKILDFGIAKVNDPQSSNLTRTGQVFGTPHYMSPEQAMGKALDHRSDIYSVGVMMYEMFTGTVPFKAESFIGILTKHVTEMPVPPSQAAPGRQINPRLEQIIMKAMDKEPDKRYASMEEMLRDLNEVQRAVTAFRDVVRPDPGMPPPPGPVGAAPAPAGWTGMQPQVPTGTAPPPGIQAGPVPGATAPPGTNAQYRAPASGGSKVGLIIGIVVGLLVISGGGGGAAWYFLWGPGKKTDESSSSDASSDEQKTKPEARTAAQTASDAGRQARTPAARDGGGIVARHVKVKVKLETNPKGAWVLMDGKKRCQTPCLLEVESALDLQLQKDGYLPEVVKLDPSDAPTKSVVLTADRRPGSRHSRHGGRHASRTGHSHARTARARHRPRARARTRPRPNPGDVDDPYSD